jgi:type 1 fimbria pilin
LNPDISQPTQFNVTVEGCSGRTTVSTSFSDANSPATTSASLKNNGTATGYALKLEVVNGGAVQILPVASSGASSRPGEIPMGIGNVNVPLVKSFNAIVTEDGGKPQPGTLDFKAIVGVAYR